MITLNIHGEETDWDNKPTTIAYESKRMALEAIAYITQFDTFDNGSVSGHSDGTTTIIGPTNVMVSADGNLNYKEISFYLELT